MRQIPYVLATQHPDSASKYVPVQEEPKEIHHCIKIGCEEYMVDYEGKLTPYHQVSQVALEVIKNSQKRLGEEFFITPRIPNAEQEGVFRQLMTLLSVIEANCIAYSEIERSAVLEIIHPLSSNVNELLRVKKRIRSLGKIIQKDFKGKVVTNIDVIPLFERTQDLCNIQKIVESYIKLLDSRKLRVFIGKSDSALLSGHLASALACRLAIYFCKKLEDKCNVSIYPILGVGSLPFRGGLREGFERSVVRCYQGIRTITAQSALRYDLEESSAKKVISRVKEEIRKRENEKIEFSKKDVDTCLKLIQIFEEEYLKVVTGIWKILMKLAPLIPNQRDRLPSQGSIYYTRTYGEIRLPRAITFTCILYTVGIPPEIIGLGRALEKIKKMFNLNISDFYPLFEKELDFLSEFINLNAARLILPKDVIKLIEKDIGNLDLESKADSMHAEISEIIVPYFLAYLNGSKKNLFKIEEVTRVKDELIIRMGKLRKSLG